MKIVFSLFGRPAELRCCLDSLSRCDEFDQWTTHIEINDASNPANREVREITAGFAQQHGSACTVIERKNGFGPDRNIFRTLRQFDERVLYCAGDVLFHSQALTRYSALNERFPENPLSLYHSFAHPLAYRDNIAVLDSFAFETLLFNPSLYFDYCLFKNWIISTISTTDWILNWVFHQRGIPIFSERFSYIQHLGVTGGNTSGRFAPRFALDYVDQPGYFEILEKLGVDLNLVKMVKQGG